MLFRMLKMPIELVSLGNKNTIKDLGIEEVIADALANKIEVISVISSGNYFNAIKKEISLQGLDIEVINLTNKKPSDPAEIKIEKNLILKNAQEREDYLNKIMPAKRIKDYTDFIPQAYNDFILNILENKPEYICLQSSKLFVTAKRIIQQNSLDTKLILVLPKNENGIFNDKNLYEDSDGKLRYKKFKPKSLASMLSTPYSSFKKEILESQRKGHIIIEATNKDFERAYKYAKNRGIKASFSGSASCLVADQNIAKKYGIDLTKKVVIVLTDKKPEDTKYNKQIYKKYGLKLIPLAASILLFTICLNQYKEIKLKNQVNECLLRYYNSIENYQAEVQREIKRGKTLTQINLGN